MNTTMTAKQKERLTQLSDDAHDMIENIQMALVVDNRKLELRTSVKKVLETIQEVYENEDLSF